jgi:hypothetical protein
MAGIFAHTLAREQRAFLGRDREAWGDHLARTRAFLGEGLARADRGRPVLVLGAGSGLEVPWEIAPSGTIGWDADPWSRTRTFLRHRRWPAWVFDDFTGAMTELDTLADRCAREPWGARRVRPRDRARTRFLGLLRSLDTRPTALESWISGNRPGTVLSANVMGQFGAVAQALLGRHLGAWWDEAFPPEELGEALEGWIARVLRAHLAALGRSSAELWLVYDRGVVHGGLQLSLGPWKDPWPQQINGLGHAELEDPLAGIDVIGELQHHGRKILRQERWLWPLAPGQMHLVEAVAAEPVRPPPEVPKK